MMRPLFLRSSFGLSLSKSKHVVESYVHGSLKAYPYKSEFLLLDLPDGYSGGASCVFNDDGKFDHYRIQMDSKLFDKACASREALDKLFVAAMVTAGHELEHIQQLEDGDSEMALQLLADYCNDVNYRRNYRFNRRDIAAEHAGLRSTCDYIRDNFPQIEKDDREAMLVAYVNDKADAFDIADDKCRYWIKKPGPDGFGSFNEVLHAFDTVYDAASEHVNKYISAFPRDCDDAFAVLTIGGVERGFDPNWEFMFDALSDAKDAHSSNLILAAAGMYVYPYMRREARGAKLPDLSIQAVFGVEPPQMKPCVRELRSFESRSATPNLDRLQSMRAEQDCRHVVDVSYGMASEYD